MYCNKNYLAGKGTICVHVEIVHFSLKFVLQIDVEIGNFLKFQMRIPALTLMVFNMNIGTSVQDDY